MRRVTVEGCTQVTVQEYGSDVDKGAGYDLGQDLGYGFGYAFFSGTATVELPIQDTRYYVCEILVSFTGTV